MTTPGEPASAAQLKGAQSPPRSSNSVPEDKWEPTSALSAAGEVLAGARQANSHRAPLDKGFGFFT